jgi:hypothetical protein
MTSAESVDFKNLPPGAVVDVETKNRHYQIECLGGNAILISGHPQYCPTPMNAELQGSSDQVGIVSPGLIERGRYLRFLVANTFPITTSRVQHIRVLTPGTDFSQTTSSRIH